MTNTFKISVFLKDEIEDRRGEILKRRILDYFGVNVSRIKVTDVYTIVGEIDEKVVEHLAKDLFLDPVIQEFSINDRNLPPFDFLLEVGFKPGVTDNVAKTAKSSIVSYLGEAKEIEVYTSKQYLFLGNLTKEEIDTIANSLILNSLVERYTIVDRETFKIDGIHFPPPRVVIKEEPKVLEIDLSVSEKELKRISETRLLALTVEEMKAIRDYLKKPSVKMEREKVGLSDKITDAELEAIAQTWSEHCKHKIFNAKITYVSGKKKIEIDSLFDTYIKKATSEVRKERGENDICVVVFSDNAGICKFSDKYNLTFKVETHNSPSALDPYGGALTGILGVNRDPFGTGKGSDLIFNTDVFCFASPFYEEKLPPGVLHPRRIFFGVREGVEHGGNKSGIPTVNGSIVFDDRFLGRPLVFCGTGGLMPKEIMGKPSWKKGARPSDYIVMVGGRVGKDGIHGATFSSQALSETSPIQAVQIGDPITQKKMFDMLIIARDRDLYNSITDNGAGGLSSSVGEMAKEAGGARLELSKVPLKYEGLSPWEILLSESQERMTLAVPKEKIEEFLELAKMMDVEATVLGEFTEKRVFHVLFEGKTVCYLDMDFFHNGLPQMELFAKWEKPKIEEKIPKEPKDLGDMLKKVLSRLNVCSKEWVVRQYDHEVQAKTVIKPLCGAYLDGPSDAAVLRADFDSFLGVVVSHGICPKYGDIDTYHMSCCAFEEGVRNALCVGASLDSLAGLDNFCWPDPIQSEKNPDGHIKLAKLVRANMALYRMAKNLKIPLISGKDSMKNDYVSKDIKISIPPTLLFSFVGRIDDVRRAKTMDFKEPFDLIYLVGITFFELGCSEYFNEIGGVSKSVPKVREKLSKKILSSIDRVQKLGLLSSCHDLSDGGLGVALAESAFSGDLGAEIDLRKVLKKGDLRDDFILFSESQSRFLVSVNKKHKDDFEKAMQDTPFSLIGEVREEKRLKVFGLSGKLIIDEDIYELKRSWKETLWFYG